MADKKETFSLDGLLGGNFWTDLDEETKKGLVGAIIAYLGKAGGLTEAQAGLLNAQRDKANVDVENEKLRQAGVRPGQYLSQRQREDILNSENRAERLDRISFHGGMGLDGRFYRSYDQWVAAGGPEARQKNSARTRGPWKQSPGRSLTKGELDELNQGRKARQGGITVADTTNDKGKVVVKARPSSGAKTVRTARVGSDGYVTMTWSDPGGSNPAKARYWGHKADRAPGHVRDRLMDEALAVVEAARKGSRAAYGGGVFGGFGGFGTGSAPANEWDWKIENSRAWERSFDRAERYRREMTEADRRSRTDWMRFLTEGLDRSFPVTKQPLFTTFDRRFLSRVDSLVKQRESGVSLPRSASKGGETMRERGWLDAVFARAERAAARGGRTRR